MLVRVCFWFDFDFSFTSFCLVFFFQAEDGIRDGTVTGVQTCLFRSLSSGPSTTPLSVEDPFLCGAADTPRAVTSANRKIVINTSARLIFFILSRVLSVRHRGKTVPPRWFEASSISLTLSVKRLRQVESLYAKNVLLRQPAISDRCALSKLFPVPFVILADTKEFIRRGIRT